MKKTLYFTLLISISLFTYENCIAQSEYVQPDPSQIEAMKILDPWVGEWNGSGWSMTGPNQRSNFEIYEKIESRLQGQVLLIEGRGMNESGDRMIHEALGILSYDPQDNTYKMRTYDLRGQVIDAEFHIEDDHYRWGFRDQESGVLLRFYITISEDHWHETTEVSPDNGDNWYHIMEMNLTKIQ